MRKTVAGEEVAAFVPHPLPPRDPPLELDSARTALLTRAEHSLARLEIAGEMVPSVDWFIYAFVRKEAVLSSQIEGTEATLVDLLEYEAERDERATDDVREVCNYLDATRYARAQLRNERGLPLSMRLLNQAHRRLMRGVRGAHKQPGEVRRSQNWVGGTRPGNAAFVPPPPEELPALIGQLESYLHAQDDGLPALVRVGLAHVQFETLHPYLDGNGRIGRLLITLLLEHWRLLSAPLLYLSLFFKRHRAEYYRLLGEVRSHGDWEAWTDFFLEGVATIADEAVAAAREVFALVSADRERLLGARSASVTAVKLMEQLPVHPIISIPTVVRLLRTTKPTAGKAVQVLESLGVLTETSGKQRDRTYAYAAYLEKLRVGTDIEPRTTGRQRR